MTHPPIFHGLQVYLVLFIEEVPRRHIISNHFHDRSYRDVDTVLEFLPILQATLLASAVMIRYRGSRPISAPNAIVSEDYRRIGELCSQNRCEDPQQCVGFQAPITSNSSSA